MYFSKPTIDDQFLLEKYIGHGGTSKVFLGYCGSDRCGNKLPQALSTTSKEEKPES